MPDKYIRRPQGYIYKSNVREQRKGYQDAIDMIEKTRENREVIYQQLISMRDEYRRELRIFKSWLRKYRNFAVALEVADELGKFQDNLDERFVEIQSRLFLEGEQSNSALSSIGRAIEAHHENEEIIRFNQDIPLHLNEEVANEITSVVMSHLPDIISRSSNPLDNENEQDQD